MGMPIECCAKCRFFKTKQGPGKDGLCRFFPQYVEKKPSEWCGQFDRDPRLVRVHQPNAAGNKQIADEMIG